MTSWFSSLILSKQSRVVLLVEVELVEEVTNEWVKPQHILLDGVGDKDLVCSPR